MTLAEQSFLLESPAAAEEARQLLATERAVRRDGRDALTRTYLDTFEWEVFHSGAVLTAERRRERLVLLFTDGARLLSCPLAGDSLPAFIEEIPQGALRDALSGAVTIRRLLSVAEVRVDSEVLAVLDERRKTVVRVVLESRTAIAEDGGESEVVGSRLRVLPVEGYERQFEDVLEVLAAVSGLERDPHGELAELLARRGRKPGDYSSRIDIALDPAAPARLAMREILRSLHSVMHANEDGTRRALDSEFLHDFRVSVRRTRTALGQLRRILPRAQVDRFRRDFSWLGSATGPCRDLDVYLLKMEDYRDLLPASAGEALAPFERHLRDLRERERAQLVRVLESERYRSLRQDWREFLDGEDGSEETGSRAEWPIAEVAAVDIHRAWKRVLKKGGKICGSTRGKKLHRLRIDCKKLRYLLEFFRGLAPATESAAAIGALKKLQDNLGDFNDYVVHKKLLGRLAEEMTDRGTAPPATLMALDQLRARLEDGERGERRTFAERFSTFASDESRQVFASLLADIEKGKAG